MLDNVTEKLRSLFDVEAETSDQPTTVDDNAEELAAYKQTNGTYVFDLKVTPAKNGKLKLYSDDLPELCNTHDFPDDLDEDQKQIKPKHALKGVDSILDSDYELKGDLYVRHKDSDVHITQNCESSGLKTGNKYQLVFVPEDVDWQPAKLIRGRAPIGDQPNLTPDP